MIVPEGCRWEVLLTYTKDNYKYADCRCSCGVEKRVRVCHIESGRSKSCGCYRKEIATEGKTGLKFKVTDTKIHSTWQGMKSRCNDRNHRSYKDYGGKGIKICEEWKHFKNFYEWAAPRGLEEEDKSIDREDSSKGYYPDNCRVITKSENNVNMLKHHYKEKTGPFSKEAFEKRKVKNRKNLGRKLTLEKRGVTLEFGSLGEAAEHIQTTTHPNSKISSIKKNLSAAASGKRSSAYGYIVSDTLKKEF
jgi:hypothetical protein